MAGTSSGCYVNAANTSETYCSVPVAQQKEAVKGKCRPGYWSLTSLSLACSFFTNSG
jgi:hypothetical protein